MTNRSLQVVAYATLVMSGALAPEAWAEDVAPLPAQVGTLRLRYGLSIRSGSQADLGPGLSYTGLTPNDFGGLAEYAFMPNLGAALQVSREGFALYTRLPPQARVTTGALVRFSAGPMGRYQVGPVLLQGMIGYQLAQLPSFGDSTNPSTTVIIIPRHAVLGAVKAMVPLPWARIEARVEYPFALGVTPPPGTPAGTRSTSSGFSAGASVVYPVGNAGTLQYSLVADYQYIQDAVAVDPTATPPLLTGSQAMHRAGLALQFDMLDHVPGLRFGSIRVQAVDEAGAAVPQAAVAVTIGGRDVTLTAGEGGYTAVDVLPGAAVAKVTAGGYFPGEAAGTVAVGREAVIKVALKKEPPKFGSLVIALVDKDGGAVIGAVKVKVRDVEKETGENGEVQFDDLGPGPAPVEIANEAWHPVSEVASIVAGKTAQMPLKLVKAKAALPGTIKGLVRSIAGKPVVATLEVPEAKIRNSTGKDLGDFEITVPGGTYTVIISAPGFITQSKTVPVKAGDQAILNVDLHPTR